MFGEYTMFYFSSSRQFQLLLYHWVYLIHSITIEVFIKFDKGFFVSKLDFDALIKFFMIYQSPRKKKIRYNLSSAVCVYVCMRVCLCDYSHTVQPKTFKFWHNIPYVNI